MFQHLDVVALRCAIRGAYKDSPELFPALQQAQKPGTKLNTATRAVLDELLTTPAAAAAALAARNRWLSEHNRPLEGFYGKIEAPVRHQPIPEPGPEPLPSHGFKVGDFIAGINCAGDRDSGAITRYVPTNIVQIEVSGRWFYAKDVTKLTVGMRVKAIWQPGNNDITGVITGIAHGSIRVEGDGAKDCGRLVELDSIQLIPQPHKEESPMPTIAAPEASPVITPDAGKALADLLKALGGSNTTDLGPILARLTDLEGKVADRPQRLNITINDAPKVELPAMRHENLGELIHWLSLGEDMYLPGPSGSGKTHSAEQAAAALNLPFYAKSFSPQATEASLLGYMDAHGKLVRTLYREAYEHGGIFLADEIDASSAAIPVVLNASLSNGFCAFPDGMVERHPNFRMICGANTWGNGKTLEYVGRNPLDGAFLNRFAMIYWDYDERLELGITPWEPWTRYVQAVRKALKEAGVKAIITPRQSIKGGKFILSGGLIETARERLIYPGLSDQAKQVAQKIALPTQPQQAKEA